MRLTKKNITHYLLDKGFLKGNTFLTGDYVLTQTMSRNCIFKIESQKSKGLFVKQLLNQDPTNCYLMQKDATSHYMIHKLPLYKKTASYIPEYHGYDLNQNILVTEYFANAKNIHEVTYEKKSLSEEHAKEMATILASFHFDIREEINDNASLQFFNGQIPWILNLGNLYNSDPSQIKNNVISETHKHPDLIKKIDAVASQWEIYSLIHGDIKWVNFIQTTDNGIKLIDWEIADLGDPFWDVAGAFQSYFSTWVMSFDNKNKHNNQQVYSTEFLRMDTILPMIKLFWDTYSSLQKFSKEEKNKHIIKCLSYMAVRMIQTAFESNMSQTELFPNSVRVLQFADHLLGNTESIAHQWNLID